MAYVVMAYIVVAHVVMAYIVVAYIVMAYVVMAHVVMAYIRARKYARVVFFVPWNSRNMIPFRLAVGPYDAENQVWISFF